nr:hypothetical protein [uncultured Schaedlerella sp.]
MATKEQMKEEFAYFGEAWKFFKRFYEVKESTYYWDSVVAEAGDLMRRYNCPLCKEVVLAIVDELERKYRARKDRA